MTASAEVRAGLVELRPELLRHAHRLVGRERGEDLVHDTIVRAIDFGGTFEEGTNLRAWAHRILWSIFVEYARKGKRRSDAYWALREGDMEWVRGKTLPAEDFLSPAIRRAIAEIPAQFAEAVLLVDVLEHMYGEAASELGIPKGTLMSRLHRGRRALAARLQQEEPLC